QLIVLVYEANADGSSTTQVEAHIVDGSGNPLANESVTFAIDSGSAQLVGAQPVLTDANGNAIISLTSTTVGYVLVTATVNGKAIIYGSPARVYFAGINIYVPRAFSPNNDGTNDLLKPILVGIADFHYFTVYNRWGNIVYTTTDPNQGWDGTFKGVPQPVETYLWIAEGIDVNGRKIVAKGMTSLVR
ncbi:MAG TPA: Ig-like domain-containing protein, partial [Puia sp.]|nr:Ig-like domain-containing protein [Puia sp.]